MLLIMSRFYVTCILIDRAYGIIVSISCTHSNNMMISAKLLKYLNVFIHLACFALDVPKWVLGQLPTGDNSQPDQNKAQLLPTRTTITRTTPH